VAKDKLKKLEAQDVDRYDFDLDRQRVETKEKVRDGKSEPFTFSEWAEKYFTFDDVKRKRSLSTDLVIIRLHLEPFFGPSLLTEITREGLCRYVDKRMGETLIRCKKASKKFVHRGHSKQRVVCLPTHATRGDERRLQVILPSFEDLIVRTKFGGRPLSADEQKKVLAVYPMWLARLAEFAKETCLSQGDLLRLTDDEIDTRLGVIKPEGGRIKTGVEQVSPLTKRAREILDENDEKSGAAQLFRTSTGLSTKEDGAPITKGMINGQVEKAVRKTKVKKFVFHNYRNTALTEWARRGIHVDVAMNAAGHDSVQMHKRYVRLRQEDIASAFGTSLEMATEIVTEEKAVSAK